MDTPNINIQLFDKYQEYQKSINALVFKKLQILSDYRKKIDQAKLAKLRETLKGQG